MRPGDAFSDLHYCYCHNTAWLEHITSVQIACADVWHPLSYVRCRAAADMKGGCPGGAAVNGCNGGMVASLRRT